MFLSHWRGSAWLIGLLVPGLFLISGCGKSKSTITGKVYYGDKLVRGGHVVFVTADDRSFPTEIDKDGTYKISGLPPGQVRIGVETESMKPAAQTRENRPPEGAQTDYRGSGGISSEEAKDRYTWIPIRYSEPKESGQTYTVKSGTQNYDIKLPVTNESGAQQPQ
jgi:hypothetical protein